MRQTNKQFGFSLIETIVAISIFVVTSIIILSLFISNSQLYKIQLAETDIKIYRANFSRDFSNAALSATEIKNSWTIGGAPYTSSSSTIIFKIPSQNTNGDIINNIFDYAVFYLENNKAYIETEADALSRRVSLKKLLADNVERLTFLYNTASPSSAGSVEALLYFIDGNNQYQPLSLNIKLRNKSN